MDSDMVLEHLCLQTESLPTTGEWHGGKRNGKVIKFIGS